MRVLIALAAAMLLAAPVHAQRNDPAGDDNARRIFEAIRDRIAGTGNDDNPDRPAQPSQGGVIGFEDIAPPAGASASTGAPLTDQYRKVHGVSFGGGASVHVCSANYDVRARIATACPYPQAASGQRAALHDVRAGGRAMQISFDQPVQSIAMRINPTGGQLDEEFIARATAFDENGARIAVSAFRFNWYQDALSWPTSISLRDDKTGRSFTRATIELLRVAQNNQPVRFLIDDLAYANAPEPALGRPPVAAGIADLDGPPAAGTGVIVSSPQIGPLQANLQKYPAPLRKRLDIDWDAVDADLAEQSALGIAAAAPSGRSARFVDIAELPLLLPTVAEPGSLQVFGNPDTMNAAWRHQGRDYGVYGSRLVTVIAPARGAPGVRSAITFSGTEDDLTASFSLYGASYAVTQYCRGGARADPDCYDRDRLGAVVESLAVVVGAAGRGRP